MFLNAEDLIAVPHSKVLKHLIKVEYIRRIILSLRYNRSDVRAGPQACMLPTTYSNCLFKKELVRVSNITVK